MHVLKKRRKFECRSLKGSLQSLEGESTSGTLNALQIVGDSKLGEFNRTIRRPSGGKIKTPSTTKIRLPNSFGVFGNVQDEEEEEEV